LEQEGRPAAQHCIGLCRSYFSERIWLLGKVFPKDVVKTIDAMSDGDLSEGFQGMSTLLECASVISALEHQNLSWTSLLNLDCIRTPHDLEAKVWGCTHSYVPKNYGVTPVLQNYPNICCSDTSSMTMDGEVAGILRKHTRWQTSC